MPSALCARRASAGFSLIEVIIVIALMAFIFAVALPQFAQRTGAESANKMSQLAGDVRAAFDMAVLSRKTYRMVFVLNTGDYWLEVASRPDVTLGSDKVDRDPTEQEEKDEQLAFEGKFEEYVELAGRAVSIPDDDIEIPPTSPVVQAKEDLKKATWSRVDTTEWGERTLGPSLMIQDMQSEHHGNKQLVTDLGPEGRAMIYFFPNGYVQRAVIHVAFKKDDMVPDETQEPYTVTTIPYEGTADVVSGYVDVDVHDDRNEEN